MEGVVMFEAVPKPVSMIFAVLILALIVYGGIIFANIRFFPQNVYGKKRGRIKAYGTTRINPNLKTIVIRCFDRRFSNAHRGFIKRELGLRRKDFYPIKIAGGPAALARPNQMAEEYGSLIIQIDLVTKHHPIEQITIISHEDCRRYDKLVDRTTCKPHPEKLDLLGAIETLSKTYPSLKVTAFYGRFVNNRRRKIYFEKIVAVKEINPAECAVETA